MNTRRTRAWRRHVLALLALGLLASALLAGRAIAEPNAPAIGWWVVAGGSGPASSGDVTSDGTLGQPFIGPSASGDITVGAGYWYGAQAPRYQLFLPVAMRNTVSP